MEKLNELVKLAGKVLSPENAFEGVDAKFEWKAKANPTAILAIAKAFRALEQNLAEVRQYNLEYAQREVELQQRAEAAEAKLAELEQQQAVGVARMELTIGREGLRYYQCFVDMRPDLVLADLNTGMELFTRPAPAADLAELVPPERNKWESSDEEGYDIDYMEPSDIYQMGKDEGFNLCRAAMLAKLENNK